MIRVLPRDIADQIAAGEVVERPASVVKELVENSLDAGATRVRVEIEDGGKSLIRVIDDGSGMTKEDLSLAFLTHATSKIASVDDLFRVASYGFRGEALASIGAVARAQIYSRRHDEALGHRITDEGGRLGELVEAGGPAGTIVEARDLFWNVPARRKFLKADGAEVAQISEILTRIALPCEEVAFTLTHQGREILSARRAADMRERAGDLFGRKDAAALLEVSFERGGVHVTGLIGLPEAARAAATRQYFFLNGRFIRDKSIGAAVVNAYEGFLLPRRYPVYYLKIAMDPADVDVNVHPTKIEVRFADRDRVFGAVHAACRDALSKARPSASWRPTFKKPTTEAGEVSATVETGDLFSATSGEARPDGDASRRGERTAETSFPAFSRDDGTVKETPAARTDRSDVATRTAGVDSTGSAHRSNATDDGSIPDRADRERSSSSASTKEFARARDIGGSPASPRDAAAHLAYEPAVGVARSAEGLSTTKSKSGSCSSGPRPNPLAKPGEFRFMQIHASYILVEDDTGFYIVDQHALHERKLFEEMCERFERREIASQPLLVPVVLDLSIAERERVLSLADAARGIGLDVATFGGNAIAVQAVPTALHRASPQRLIDALLRVEDEKISTGFADIHRALLAGLACRAAVKFNDRLADEEIRALLEWERTSPASAACPHGRPTRLRITLAELEQRFLRKA